MGSIEFFIKYHWNSKLTLAALASAEAVVVSLATFTVHTGDSRFARALTRGQVTQVTHTSGDVTETRQTLSFNVSSGVLQTKPQSTMNRLVKVQYILIALVLP